MDNPDILKQHLARAAFALMACAFGQTTRAQSPESFFRHKQLSLIVGYNPGGSYDLYGSLAANAFSRYIPGNPTVVLKYLPGFGGLKAANYLQTQAPRDGLTVALIAQSAALRQTLGEPGIEFDVRKLSWIGRLASAVEVTLAWHTSPVKTLADARTHETVLAATSAGSTTDIFPRLMNQFAGTKFKIVKGYPGTTGAALAMERGEVEGAHETLDTLLFSKPDWLRDKKVSILVQYALQRHRAFPDVPAMIDVARTAQERQLIELFGSTAEIGRALVSSPDLPPGRLEILRRAFDAMVADPAFQNEVQQRNLDLGPMTGEQLQARVAQSLEVPRDVVQKAIAISAQ